MREKIIEKLALMMVDSIAVGIAFVGAYYLRLGTFDHSEFLFFPYLTMGMGMIPFWIIFLMYEGRYSLREKTIFQEIKIIIISSLASALLFPLMFYFTNERFFSRGIIVYIFVIGSALLLFISGIQKKISQHRSQKNISLSRMLIIGANRSTEKVIETLIKKFSHHKPVAILTPYGSKKKKISGVPVFGKLDALEKIFLSEKIDEIFLCEGIEHSENLASFCRNKGIPMRASFETLGISPEQTQAETIEGMTFLSIHQSPLFGWGQFFKRIFDVVISLLGLVIFTPYFIINWEFLTTKKFKNGAKQENTFDGYIFLKTVEKKPVYFGHNISLLINVLKKDMSIVGPKDLTQREYEYIFEGKEEASEVRFILRPGIFSPHTFTCLTAEKILRSEILYIKNWNFFTDIKIFLSRIF